MLGIGQRQRGSGLGELWRGLRWRRWGRRERIGRLGADGYRGQCERKGGQPAETGTWGATEHKAFAADCEHQEVFQS